MGYGTRKLAVLHQLSQESEGISIGDLLTKLGDAFSERTVRRWLSEFIKDGIVKREGKARKSVYKIIEKNRRKVAPEESCFSTPSKKVIQKVKQPLFNRLPVTYADEWINAYQPNVTFYIPQELRTQLHDAGNRSTDDEPAGTYAHKIYNRLLIDLSYNSSRFEGNTYSLLDTQILLLEGKSAEGKLNEEKVMILNHKETIRYLVDHATKIQIKKNTILTIHYLLAEGLVESHLVGIVRDHGVRISGSTNIPFEDPADIDKRLEKVIIQAAQIEDPFEQSFFLLVHLSYLQAFADVNKRTGRLAANIPLIQKNYVPLSFNDVERDDHTSACIAIYELQEVRPLLDLYVFSYMRTCAQYDAAIKALGFDELRIRYRQERRSIVGAVIAKNLHREAMKQFIRARVEALVNPTARENVIEDIEEDLRYIDHNRIYGLGITPRQLDDWLAGPTG